MEPKRVVVFGAFDLLHQGHQDLFRQAKKYGSHLTVVVGRDETIHKRKGRYPAEPEEVRLAKVRKNPQVDQAVLGYLSTTIQDQLKIITKLKPDLICLGYDQEPTAQELKELMSSQGMKKIKIKTLKPYQPEKYKSSKLRHAVE